MDIKIEIASAADAAEISSLAYRIWNDRYSEMISQEQIDYMLNKFQSESAIREQINSTYRYYTVVIDHIMVGYLSVEKRGGALFLSKLYLESGCAGLGIGKMMFDKVKDVAREQGLSAIELTVNKYNNSYNIYLKWGLKVVDSVVADIGEGYVMDDYVMRYDL